MTAIRFNPLTYSEKLESAGIDKKAANVIAQEQAEIISNILNNEVATKNDTTEIKKEIISIKNEIVLLEQRLTIKLGGLMIAGMSILGFILKH